MEEDPKVVPPASSGDELREEFKMAQRRRLLHHGMVLWRETDAPEEGPQAAEPPVPPKTK